MGSYWVEKYKTASGTRWHVRYRDESGKKQTVPNSRTKKKRLAVSIRNKMEEKGTISDHGLIDPDITVSALCGFYIAYRKSLNRRPRTIQAIEYACGKLKAKFGDAKATRLIKPHLQRWKDELLQRHSVNGFKDIWRVVEAVFRHGVSRGHLAQNPAAGVDDLEAIKVHRFLNDREVQIVFKVFERNDGMARLVKTALYEFMRKNEILLLRPDQVKREPVWQNGRKIATARIFMEKDQIKTKKDKSVPVHPECEPFLIETDPGKWFNRGWSVNRLNRAWTRGIGRANRLFPGFGRVRFHDLKHTACSNYLKNGGTLAELADMTGNDVESLASTYAHFETKHFHEKIVLVAYPVTDKERNEIEDGAISHKKSGTGLGQIVGQTSTNTANNRKQRQRSVAEHNDTFTVDE